MDIKILKESVTFPKGFKATGGHTGIKKQDMDMAIILSDYPAEAAGCFTLNIVKAAPVLWDMEIIKNKNTVKAVVINSGNANACTGEKGYEDCKKTAETFAEKNQLSPHEVFICSTGVIGVPLPMEKIEKGVNVLSENLDYALSAGNLAAKAIMTTDTYEKTAACEFFISGKPVRIGAMAKGSGMIHPNMATMLGFINTDIAISKDLLQKALTEAIEKTFNMITVDGDTSTNDTVLLLANGGAKNEKIVSEGPEYDIFKLALLQICKALAISIAKDGEGATKLMEIAVIGAASEKDASLIAKSVAGSSLFKAALFGEDANWGRVLCAMGYSGGFFNPESTVLSFHSFENGVKKEIYLMENGSPLSFSEEEAKNILKENEIYINILLKDGNGEAKAWGCDLTYDYVKINGDYRS